MSKELHHPVWQNYSKLLLPFSRALRIAKSISMFCFSLILYTVICCNNESNDELQIFL